MKLCSVVHCNNVSCKLTFCSKHYQRWRKHGSVDVNNRDLLNKRRSAEAKEFWELHKEEILDLYFNEKYSQRQIAELFHVSQTELSRVLRVYFSESCRTRGTCEGKPKKNLVGKGVGQLVVQEFYGKTNSKKCKWLCNCICGNQTVVSTDKLNSGHTQSCGCLHASVMKELLTTHGQTGTRGYVNYCKSLRRKDIKLRTPAWSSRSKILEVYKNCPKGMSIDHVIPLRGKLISGLHIPENLQYLSLTDNLKKGNKFIPIIQSK